MHENESPILLSTHPPLPPRAKQRSYPSVTIFVGAFLRTIGVGFGLLILFVAFVVLTTVTEKSQCNVSVRTLHGELSTTAYEMGIVDSGELVRSLMLDENDESIKAVILDIDSPGGLPVAGEEVANQLTRLTKPNVAVIRSVGASAAYWAASGAERIFASRSSDVGSIGVMVSFPDESEKNKQEGISYNEFATGKYKNLGTPTRPITPDERILLEQGLADVFDHFIESVAFARGMATTTVRTLADGATMGGQKALERGLIDEIGGIEEARLYVERQIGEKAVLCEPDFIPLSLSSL